LAASSAEKNILDSVNDDLPEEDIPLHRVSWASSVVLVIRAVHTGVRRTCASPREIDNPVLTDGWIPLCIMRHHPIDNLLGRLPKQHLVMGGLLIGREPGCLRVDCSDTFDDIAQDKRAYTVDRANTRRTCAADLTRNRIDGNNGERVPSVCQ
jgi:hypothetical protein